MPLPLERDYLRLLQRTFEPLGVGVSAQQPVPEHPLHIDLLLEGIEQPERSLWPPLWAAFEARRWVLELFVRSAPSLESVASALSKGWERVRAAAAGGQPLPAARHGLLLLCWGPGVPSGVLTGSPVQLAPGVRHWGWGSLGLFEVRLRELPEEPGYSALRLLGRTEAARLREAAADGTLSEELRSELMGAVRELARELGDEELLQMSTEELRAYARQEGLHEGIELGKRQGIELGKRQGIELGRRAAMLEMARRLLGPEAAERLEQAGDLDAMQRLLERMLAERHGG